MKKQNEIIKKREELLQKVYNDINSEIMKFYDANVSIIHEKCTEQKTEYIQILGLKIPWETDKRQRKIIDLTLRINNDVKYSIAIIDTEQPININDDYVVIDSNKYYEEMGHNLNELVEIVVVLQNNSLEDIIRNSAGNEEKKDVISL